MRHFRSGSILLLVILLLTGCWDRKEINDLAFITSTGIDKEAENKFRVAFVIPLPSALSSASGGGGGTSGNKPYYVDSDTGRNVGEAYERLQGRMSREQFYAHRRVFVVGRELAEGGMKPSLDAILETPASRLSTLLVLAEGEALDVLTSSPHLEQFPTEAIREMALSSIHVDVRNALDDIYKPGKDPVLPIVKPVDTENNGKDKRKEIQMGDVGIFEDDQLKFITKGKETLGVFWLLKKMKNKTFVIPIEEDSEINVKVLNYKLKTNYKIKNNLPEFTVKINVSTSLQQNEPKVKLENLQEYKKVTRKMEKEVEQQVSSLLNHAKAEGVDPFGLGLEVSRYDNEFWVKHLESRWRELLKEIKVSTEVTGEIERINFRSIRED
ncbi:Ger(x)C family spore germination protein [Robertmurraya andreesenii]|uniref:Ger(X)C family germination protein n=1 Tax=Anoxybacillus andreesenii TaxID=1325932 RepID=A0ABT9V888_9BACL|nr:Ger(x)C family spore germination protein [Robertmurraya andreesenii]MDQ0157154.1 Ger(x)C family germination protein [Robertmurraya andreesenii]